MTKCCVKGCDKKSTARGLCTMHYRRMRLYGSPLLTKQKQNHGLTLRERLLARVDRSGECWEWTGSKDNRGYGRLNIGNRPYLAHRASWQAFRGEIPEGAHVLHRCDNPKCIRPGHLFLGTHQDNMDDKGRKGRHKFGVSQGEAHGCAKLTEQQVLEIRKSEGPSRIVAEKYGVSGRQVRDIRALKVWKHI